MEGQGEHNADSHMGKPYTTGHELLLPRPIHVHIITLLDV